MGKKADLLFMPGGGSRCPATAHSVESRMHYLRMEGKETFKNAVQAMQRPPRKHCAAARLILQDQMHYPHQANRRIIEAVGERLNARPEQLFINVDKYGKYLCGLGCYRPR